MYSLIKSTINLPVFPLHFLILLALASTSCNSDTTETLANPDPIPTSLNAEEQVNVPVPEEQAQTSNKPVPIHPPYLHSPIYLTNLAQTEQLVYEALVNYEKQLQERLQILQRYRLDFEDSVAQALIQSGKLNEPDSWTKAYVVSSNPLLTYRMIRRFTKEFPAFTEHLWKSLENDLWQTLETLRGDFDWPSQDDMESATKSLIRLQDTYDFDLDYFTNGVIRSYPLKVGITAQQSLEISQTALAQGNIIAATEWYQAAHSKAVHGQYKNAPQNYVPMKELTDAWEKTYKAGIWPATVFKTHDVFAESKTMLRKDFDRLKSNLNFDNRKLNFKALCRRDKLKNEAELAKLTCFNDRTFHPFLRVSPLKVEIHNWDPFIYQVYDFMGPSSMYDMGVSAISTIASVVESGLGQSQVQNELISTFSYGWVDERTVPTFRQLSEKLARFVGMAELVGEGTPGNYQISAYAVGNHYEPCIECFNFKAGENEPKDNGMKTKVAIHAVLHEPEQGGELAFTLSGTLVKPVRGSVIIHYNLNSETKEPDERTLHGSCPVLIGQKWLATILVPNL